MPPWIARWLSAGFITTIVVGFVVALVGCASVRALTPVAVSDIHSVAGRWAGKVYSSRDVKPESVELVIQEDGSYHIESREIHGASHGRGKIMLREGRLILQGEDSSRGIATLHTSSDGHRFLNVEATTSDNRMLSVELTPSR